MELAAIAPSLSLVLPPSSSAPVPSRSLVARAMRVLPFSEALCRELASDPESGLRELVDDAELRHAFRPDSGPTALARRAG